MALQSLGDFNVNTPYEWVSFGSIELRDNFFYFLEVNFQSSNPSLIYSNFDIRAGYLNNGNSWRTPPFAVVDYDSETLAVKFVVNRYFGNDPMFFPQVRRRPLWRDLSELADVSMEISVDPEERERP